MQIANIVKKVLKAGETCHALGGDHSMTIGSIAGHARVELDLLVLWIDANADINTPMTSENGNIHGVPHSFLVRELDPYVPKLSFFEWLSPWQLTCFIHLKRVRYFKIDAKVRAVSDTISGPIVAKHAEVNTIIASLPSRRELVTDVEGFQDECLRRTWPSHRQYTPIGYKPIMSGPGAH
ncbi:hypothetical protein CHS0354_011816 [Potamilus streckersoni]|uniref:Arginase n=1 Tax=Potamilus streckersoni TaxID=2493646 RepID=A0AAE0WDW0_9BIVA|nr:hypothetical protein CHS0354_011816 [Potamilus streckersoni]